MTFFTLLGMWIVWLVIAALILRWVIGGTIDCIKRGRSAGLISWMGFVMLILIIFILIIA